MSRSSWTCILIFAGLLSFSPCAAQSPSRDAAVGVWPWLVGNIDSDVPNIIQQCQLSGLDTIYLHLFRTTGVGTGTLHMFDEAGAWNSSWGPIDPDVTLSAFIAQAHAAGLQVVGVVNCFLSGTPLPGNALHEQVLLDVLGYLVNTFSPGGQPRYALDGIALDRARFYDGLTNPHQAVTAFMQAVRDRIGLTPLHAFLPANLWHIDGPPYNGSFRSYPEAMGLLQGQYGHHWEDLSQVLDVSLPMAYIAEGGLYGSDYGLMQAYLQTVATYARAAATIGGVPALRILPAVRAWNDSSGTTTPGSLGSSILGAALGGADGTMPFRYYTALGQTAWWNVIGAGAEPGQDLPLAELAGTSTGGISVHLDASASMNPSQASGPQPLQFRFDLDDDGQADTAWSTSPAWDFVLPQAGSRVVAVEVKDGAGRRAARKRRISVLVDTLTASPAALSTTLGGTTNLSIFAGPAAAGTTYVIAGSMSGTSPGTVISPSLTAPLNLDLFSISVLSLANTPFLPNFVGTLDATGSATGSVHVGAGVMPLSLAWHSLHFCALAGFPITAEHSFVTNAPSILILP